MISHWPEVGETETLFSIASRLHYLRGSPSSQKTSQWLFGFSTAASLRFSPRNLDHFISTTSGMLGRATEILRNRTPVGQFVPFISQSAWSQWETWCRSLPSSTKPFIAIRNMGIPHRAPLKVCPQCALIDQDQFGSSIWRLEHQLLGSFVCIHHGCPLLEEIHHLKREADSANAWIRPDDCLEGGHLKTCLPLPDIQQMAFWSHLSKISWILATHPRVNGILLRELISKRLSHIGIVPTSKRLHSSNLRAWWSSIDRPSFLWSKSLESIDDPEWISRLLLGRRHDHPLRWAMLCSATMSPEALQIALTEAPSLQMTLEGKWQSSVRLREDLLSPEVWAMLASGISIPDVSVRSGIPASNLRHALNLNPAIQRQRARVVANLNRDSRRNVVTTYLQANPEAGRAGLLRNHSAELRWLEMNDWPWISQMLGGAKSNRFVQRTLDFGTSESSDQSVGR